MLRCLHASHSKAGQNMSHVLIGPWTRVPPCCPQATGTVMSMTESTVPPAPTEEHSAGASSGRPSLVEWQERLRVSSGFRGIALKNQVKRIGYIFQGNVAQYKSLVASLQNPAVSFPIMDVRNPDAHDNLLSEAERLLHNVLTAMSTRVDHQRRFMSKYFADDPMFTGEYLEKITSIFGGSTEAAFLKDLRNYITHLQLPVAQSRQKFGPEVFSITFILPSKALLDWDGWNSSMRKWIAGQGEAVAIVDIVDEYARQVGGFDKWLFDRIGLKYATEIDSFLREQEEYSRELGRIFGHT